MKFYTVWRYKLFCCDIFITIWSNFFLLLQLTYLDFMMQLFHSVCDFPHPNHLENKYTLPTHTRSISQRSRLWVETSSFTPVFAFFVLSFAVSYVCRRFSEVIKFDGKIGISGFSRHMTVCRSSRAGMKMTNSDRDLHKVGLKVFPIYHAYVPITHWGWEQPTLT